MILITGVKGFIGANFLNYILEENSVKLEELVVLSSEKNEQVKTILHQNYTFSKEDFLNNGIDKIDILIHIGAYTPKTKSDSNLIDENVSNIVNTVHLLNNLPSIPKKVIFISTLDVYKITKDKINEKSEVLPETFYGKCKLFCENYMQEWCIQKSVTLQILRLGHIYGIGEDLYEKFIPLTIKKIRSNETPALYTTGEEKRSFIHVKDCVRLIFNSINLNDSEIINIVSKNSYSINEILQFILKIANKEDLIVEKGKHIGYDLIFDYSKMERLLGKEKEDIYEGLKSEYFD